MGRLQKPIRLQVNHKIEKAGHESGNPQFNYSTGFKKQMVEMLDVNSSVGLNPGIGMASMIHTPRSSQEQKRSAFKYIIAGGSSYLKGITNNQNGMDDILGVKHRRDNTS